MFKDSLQITVLFEDPFWVGILERKTTEGYAVAKNTFGSEPTDNEVYHFLLNQFDKLQFSKPMLVTEKPVKRANPKRKLREARKLMQNNNGVSKAHEAIKLMHENMKAVVKKETKLKREELKKLRFHIRQVKKKQKHKGK